MSQAQPDVFRGELTLSAPPPVRALAIAAGLTVVGALLLVLGETYDWPVGLVVLAVVLLVLGVALAVTGLVVTTRTRTVVRLDPEQIVVARAGKTAGARWAEVRTAGVAGQVLVLRGKDGQPVLTIVNPRARHSSTFLALQSEIQRRLDADRGYRPTS